ncbi:hemolysin family protein [Williamwhitmania taraxaci]|uniref:Putative hemolysin n=1 Tax=Williamwhitmania taraxaci TaxID=1640674 RepID=A0A1G6JPV2_9BACT|nr:hemolysin family protein [Williamwhitmania taraxaci]SDC20733.1 putative hemolysin [Williamwhitmania taraxaci]
MEFIVLGLLILLNGFFSLSEIALVSCKQSRLEQAKIAGSKGAKIALRLLSDSESFLSATQVGITLIGIITGVFGGVSIAEDLIPFIKGFSLTAPYASEIALTSTIILITYVSIVIGELVPKTIAMSNPESIAIKVAPAIYYFSSFFYPFVRILSFSTSFVNRLIGVKERSDRVTEEELRHMIKIASNEGVIKKGQNLIHEKVFYFSEKRAKHLMTHRTDVELLDISLSPEVFHQTVLQLKHSKVIVFRKYPDDFIGVLSIKDYLLNKSLAIPKPVEEILLKPVIVADTTNAQQLVALFRQMHNYFAVVVDEYGSFEGIVTLHDIMENIIGSMPDEWEEPEPDVFVREDKSVLVSGDAPLETLTEIIEDFTIDFEEIGYSTVAGFVFNRINKIPQLGDKFTFRDYTIEIVDIDRNKIDKVLIRKREK